MNKAAISVQRLGKTYRLYARHLDRIKEALHPMRRRYHQDFYALRDVSLEAGSGETLGIIGKNGSGKSTLLKIITGVVTPTTGQVRVQGKIAALLELGAGFNPELSGLENVYFTGTIMGYSRAEMDARVDAIRQFADIGDYLAQPVKTYSSGMFVRLAFAVAINVDPDILIVDEAIAVGDMSFQAKCYRKFNDFRESGKTIIFVSHALDSVIRYCDRVLVLDRGCKIMEGNPKAAVDAYKKILVQRDVETPLSESAIGSKPSSALLKDNFKLDAEALAYGDRRAEIEDFGICDEAGSPTQLLINGMVFTVRMRIRFHVDLNDPIFAFTIKDLKGLEMTGTNTWFKQVETGSFHKGNEVLVEFRQVLNIQAGRYALSLGCVGFEQEQFVVYHRLYDVILFEVASSSPMVGFYDLHSEITLCRDDLVKLQS